MAATLALPLGRTPLEVNDPSVLTEVEAAFARYEQALLVPTFGCEAVLVRVGRALEQVMA